MAESVGSTHFYWDSFAFSMRLCRKYALQEHKLHLKLRLLAIHFGVYIFECGRAIMFKPAIGSYLSSTPSFITNLLRLSFEMVIAFVFLKKASCFCLFINGILWNGYFYRVKPRYRHTIKCLLRVTTIYVILCLGGSYLGFLSHNIMLSAVAIIV